MKQYIGRVRKSTAGLSMKTIVLATAVAAVLGAYMVSIGLAETVVAPKLNCTTNFSSESAPADELKVNPGPTTAVAKEAIKLQGYIESKIIVCTQPAPANTESKIADVWDRDGESFYRVTGTVIGGAGAGGGGSSDWTVDYNKGPARLVLDINGPAMTDDDILPIEKGATLTITLIGVPEGNYSVTIAKKDNSGDGTVSCPASPVSFNGPGQKTVDLTGVHAGQLTILATCTNGLTAEIVGYVSPLALDELTFETQDGCGKIFPVLQDKDKSAYPIPQWKRGRTTQSPLCFTSGAKAKIKAKFIVATGFEGEVNVRGIWGPSNNLEFATTTRPTISNGTATIEVSDLKCDQPFVTADVIQEGTDENVEWWVTTNGSTHIYVAGDSDMHKYGVYSDPSNPTERLLHTALDISCAAGNGMKLTSNEEKIAFVDALYAKFQPKVVGDAPSVRNVAGKEMSYWQHQGPTTKPSYSTQKLVSTGDGRCGAWCNLFLDCVRVQGSDIGAGIKSISVDGDAEVHSYLLYVKNWDTSNADAAKWTMLEGIKAQGGEPQQKKFSNHAVIVWSLSNKWYDPSYGYPAYDYTNPGAALLKWQREALDAVAKKDNTGININPDDGTWASIPLEMTNGRE